MSANYITLTRQSLYELVWSKPMTTLAKEFGISDVALAKRCYRYRSTVAPSQRTRREHRLLLLSRRCAKVQSRRFTKRCGRLSPKHQSR